MAIIAAGYSYVTLYVANCKTSRVRWLSGEPKFIQDREVICFCDRDQIAGEMRL